MDTNHCKAIRLQIDETDLGEELAPGTLDHLRRCNECAGFFESEVKLRKLVASLPQVEAPADFDFRLRARIARTRSRSSVSFRGIGLPATAALALVLLAGGMLFVRNNRAVKETSTTVLSESNNGRRIDTSLKSSAPNVPVTSSASEETISQLESKPGPRSNVREGRGNKQFVAMDKSRTVSRDSSSTGATVVRQDDAVAGSQLPLVFPLQTLKVSLDEGTGVARTISFPTVSFGSERTLTRNGNSFQGSVKRDW